MVELKLRPERSRIGKSDCSTKIDEKRPPVILWFDINRKKLGSFRNVHVGTYCRNVTKEWSFRNKIFHNCPMCITWWYFVYFVDCLERSQLGIGQVYPPVATNGEGSIFANITETGKCPAFMREWTEELLELFTGRNNTSIFPLFKLV